MTDRLTEEQILDYYREWSNERDAQFIIPDEDQVREFREWLSSTERTILEPEERQLINEYRRQEAEEGESCSF